MGYDGATRRPAQDDALEAAQPRVEPTPVPPVAVPGPMSARPVAAQVMALQRSAGNRAVQRLVSAGGPAALARLKRSQDLDDADLEDEADEFDDEAADYIYDPNRNPHTLGQYLGPALAGAKAADDAKLKAAADAKAKQDAEAKAAADAAAKVKQAEETQKRLAEEAKQAADAKAVAEAAEKARAAAEEKARLEAEAKAKEEGEARAKAEAEAKARTVAEEEKKRLEEEARQAADAKAKADADEKLKAAEAARIKAEAKKKAEEDAAAKKKAEDDAKKSAIAVELQKKLVDLVNGKQVDRWALLTVVQQTALVDQVFNQKATFEAYQAAKKSGVEQSNVVVNAMRAADLDADKVWLRRGVAALGAPAVITEMYLAAINLHTYSSSSYGLTIEKSYLEADIIAAAGSWWRIPEMWVDNPNGPPNRVQVKSMLKVVSNVHSPGSNATEIAWKERGDYMERTRNLILRVNGLPSNVHLHPDKNWRKKKK